MEKAILLYVVHIPCWEPQNKYLYIRRFLSSTEVLYSGTVIVICKT